MTTILYDHASRKIAVDGQTTAGNVICSYEAEKWIKDDSGGWWFICGARADRERLVQHISNPDSDAPKWPIDCSAFLVRDGKVYHCVVTDDGEPVKSEIHYSDAMGSGALFALSSLDHGKSVKEAVEYASTRDTGTGGKIRVFDVDKLEFCDD